MNISTVSFQAKPSGVALRDNHRKNEKIPVNLLANSAAQPASVVSFAGWGSNFLALFKTKKTSPKTFQEPQMPKAITVEELHRLSKANKLTVEQLLKFTPESLKALPEREKESLWYCNGIIIGDDGVPYKEPLTSSRYK